MGAASPGLCVRARPWSCRKKSARNPGPPPCLPLARWGGGAPSLVRSRPRTSHWHAVATEPPPFKLDHTTPSQTRRRSRFMPEPGGIESDSPVRRACPDRALSDATDSRFPASPSQCFVPKHGFQPCQKSRRAPPSLLPQAAAEVLAPQRPSAARSYLDSVFLSSFMSFSVSSSFLNTC